MGYIGSFRKIRMTSPCFSTPIAISAVERLPSTCFIAKADSAVTTAPTAINRSYDGTSKALITDNAVASNGTMVYALGEDAVNAPEGEYSTTIPAAANAGTYYVWYKVVGNPGYSDSEVAYVALTVTEAQ